MITSLENKRVKEWNRLKQKKYRKDSFLLYDEGLIIQAKNKNYLKTLIYKNKKPFEFEEAYEVSDEVFNKLCEDNNKKYIGISNLLNSDFIYHDRVLLLDHLQDPTNIGTIIKNAKIFGFDSIILSENSGDLYNEKTIINADHAFFDINIKVSKLDKEIEILKDLGFVIFATGLDNNTRDLNNIETKEKMCFVLGNEGSGISDEIFSLSDMKIKIPMSNIDSLNVAIAASIIMYKFRK